MLKKALVAVTAILAVGVIAPAAAQADAQAALASCGQRTDIYDNIGTHYPFSYAGRQIGLMNGTQRDYTFAMASGVRKGDVLILQQSNKTFTKRWVTSSEVAGSSYTLCSATYSGTGAGYLQTQSIENWHVPVRACFYPVEGGGYCHDWWYVDIT